MKIHTLLLLVALAVIAAFAALNWTTFTTPTTLSLGFTAVQAPLGLVMLGALSFLTVLFLVFMIYLQTSVLFESRRHARELQANRELADQAETSRFTELRTFMETEIAKQTALNEESNAAMQAKIDQLNQDLITAIEQSGNTLAAYIGEMDDRLERGDDDQTPNLLPDIADEEKEI
ncbi:MAG: LapA family protein [Proteobacteria bacterium]|nr:LapA family protein [Pseudomonadota bacterium]